MIQMILLLALIAMDKVTRFKNSKLLLDFGNNSKSHVTNVVEKERLSLQLAMFAKIAKLFQDTKLTAFLLKKVFKMETK